MALDEVYAISADRRSPTREVEIELKEGRASDLFVFAPKVDTVASFQIGVRSKAERGPNAAAAFKAIAL